MTQRQIILSFFLAVTLSFLAAPAAYASFERGKEAYDSKDWKQAIFYLRPLAEQGDDRAMIVLGNMYSQGLGVGQDDQEAFSLYKKAALKGNADAMAAIGAMYQEGRGTARNMRLSAAWYGRAAQTGQKAAAALYALLMYRGNKSDNPLYDLKPDHVESYRWFTIAAHEAQNRKTQEALRKMADKVAEKLDRRDIARVDGEVSVWKPVAIDKLGPPPEEAPSAAQDKTAPPATDK